MIDALRRAGNESASQRTDAASRLQTRRLVSLALVTVTGLIIVRYFMWLSSASLFQDMRVYRDGARRLGGGITLR